MKTMIIIALLALNTGLAGVFGAPVAVANSDLTARGDLEYGSVVSGGNDAINVAARDEEKKGRHHYCDNNPLCWPTPLPPKKRDGNAAPVEDVITERDEEHRVHHGDPYWCGAPFCGSKEKRDDNAAPVENVITERDEDKKPHKSKIWWDPYWCGAPFCPKPSMAVRQLDFSPTEKRSESIVKCWEDPNGQRGEEIVKCWEDPNGQVHCDNPPYPPRSVADLSKRGEDIVKCWEDPNGQVHCDNPPYPPRSVSKRFEGITKCWEAPDGQIHCQAFKREAEPVVDVSHSLSLSTLAAAAPAPVFRLLTLCKDQRIGTQPPSPYPSMVLCGGV
ncbi:hypothetical protein G7Y79_00080g100580 [Physcia stellaris]|nr:hypothetical protein G7Y79_00080g100580 [Physcia stellaris]